ncbi:MAG: protein-disulfide reductase DsbD [Rhodocyclaceae bacterium]|nr:protein-disulfide reductase DsbD [Rhodocyclaceae bacterium]
MLTRRMFRPVILCLPLLVLGGLCRFALAAGDAGPADAVPLPPEQVFAVDAVRAADGGIDLRFGIRDGYYLYRERIHAAADPAGGAALTLDLPPGTPKVDPNFGRVETYRGEAAGRVSGGPAGTWTLAVRYQGCADAGLCYPPQTARFRVASDAVTPLGGGLAALARSTAGAPGGSLGGLALAPAASPDLAGEDESERVARALFSDSLPLTLAAFFGAGLLLALTPCMLPMVPILSGIIVGQAGPGAGGPGATQRSAADRRRAFRLSLAYVLAMAVTYALAGVAAGLSGVLLSSLLQDPRVLVGFAGVFVVLALSMFGLFELQLPAGVQAWAAGVSNRVPGGQMSGAAAMGALSALIVGPCIAPPLAGALLFISRSGDVWLGGGALFTLALGMGVPLLVVGTSAGHLMTRANAWYGRIRVVFGAMLLGVAVWITQPVWWPVWEHLELDGSVAAAPAFEHVDSLQQVRAALADTGGRPVLLDFTADWCTTCRELERRTFADAAVANRLQDWRRLRFDVTASTPADREALAAFGLFGPPAVLLFDSHGIEARAQRVLNFQPPDAFLGRLDTFKARP